MVLNYGRAGRALSTSAARHCAGTGGDLSQAEISQGPRRQRGRSRPGAGIARSLRSAVVHACSSSRHPPDPLSAGPFPQRSPHRLLTGAARAGDLLHRHHSPFRTHRRSSDLAPPAHGGWSRSVRSLGAPEPASGWTRRPSWSGRGPWRVVHDPVVAAAGADAAGAGAVPAEHLRRGRTIPSIRLSGSEFRVSPERSLSTA